MKHNKYKYIYVLQGFYYGWEDLTESENYKEIKNDYKDYKENERVPHRIIQRRVLNQ